MKVPRGGLEANDLVSLGGVRLGSDPLTIELRSVPSTLLLLEETDSRCPGENVNQRRGHESNEQCIPAQVNTDLGPMVNAESNCMATALIVDQLGRPRL